MSNSTDVQSHSQPLNYLNQSGFQRLYLEYFALIRELDVDDISKLYNEGIQYNLKKAHFSPDNLRYVQTDIRTEATNIHNELTKLKEELSPRMSAESASLQRKLAEALDSEEDDLEMISALEGEFIDYLNAEPGDIVAQFNLAWLYFHLLSDFEAACMRFTEVADISILEDNPLAELALRYLAISHYFQGEHAEACMSLKRAASLDQTNSLYYLYEIAQQSIKSDDTDVAISHIKALIKHSPLYYLHIESDPFFMKNEAVDDLLSRFHAAKLESIKEATFQKWNSSNIMQQDLPAEFNKNEMFEKTLEEHVPLLSHQPYPVLCKTEQISTKLLKNLNNKAQKKLSLIDQIFTKHMEQEQRKWKVVNIAGVTLIYIAVLLTLASIFLFVGGDLFGLNTQERSIDWGKLVPQIFAAVVGTGVIGILLLQFNPPKLKELAKKKSLLNQVMESTAQ